MNNTIAKLSAYDIYQYLPYELKGIIIYPNGNNEICVLMQRCGKNNRTDVDGFVNGTYTTLPILKPLSDLSESHMQSLVALASEFRDNSPELNGYMECHIDSLKLDITTKVLEYLYKNHYDVKNLIGRGLGISIHDVDKYIE